jgi:hypothetical protein
MSDPENPLSRWSRRKRRAATANKHANATSDAVAPPRMTEVQASGEARPGAEPIEPTLDPEILPPLDSITAQTDIRAFLAPGVPPELTRAALRRAWRADPKIRDFVGLADYDWDFNTEGAMAGFGSLDLTEELRNQIIQAIGGSAEPAEVSIRQETPPQPADIRALGDDKSAPPREAERADDQDRLSGASTQGDREDTAMQHQPEKPQSQPPVMRRKQGGALPT